MYFWKMQGCGNDFIIYDNRDTLYNEAELSAMAKHYCARRLSIGADGFMAVEKSDCADFRMRFFNSDGSIGEMCGNGARCIARYGFERGLSGNVQHIETTAGLVSAERNTQREYTVHLNLPTVLDERIAEGYPCGYVELGSPGLPHAVLLLQDWDLREENTLRELGRTLRYSETFPKGANVSFLKKVGEEHYKIRTFERGVEDFTLACGTGCGSSVSVLTMRGLSSGRNVRLDSDGGTLHVTLKRENGNITELLLQGPTTIVATGETVD